MQKSNLHIFLLPALFALLFSSCEKYEEHPLPAVAVNFTINVYDAEFIDLSAQGNAMAVRAFMLGRNSLGYDNNGILIYNIGGDEFAAYDMTCPHDLPVSIGVEMVGGTAGNMAECPECGSTYILSSDAQPSTDSPSKWALKKYRAYYYPSSGNLEVSN